MEISLHPLTSYYFLKGNQTNELIYQPSLFRETDSWDSFTQSVRTLYQRGVNPAASASDPGFIDLLPLYPWDRNYFEIPYDNYGHFEDNRPIDERDFDAEGPADEPVDAPAPDDAERARRQNLL